MLRNAVALASIAILAGCGSAAGSGPTAPGPLFAPGSAINYTAMGASDAIGVGASVFCFPFVDCPDGRGYVHVAVRELRARGFTVNLANLGIPATVLSRRIQNLGAQYGRTIPGNFHDQQMPFVLDTANLITIFAGINDVDTIIAAVGGGAAGADQAGYITSQIQAFGQDFATLVRTVRERARSARVIVLNLPNMAGMPRFANFPVQHRRAAQMLSVGITATAINQYVTQGIVVVDLMCDPRSYEPSTYSGDGFHPSDTGYAWMAAEVVAAATTSYRTPAAGCAHTSLVN